MNNCDCINKDPNGNCHDEVGNEIPIIEDYDDGFDYSLS
jgi:hypothetical protein